MARGGEERRGNVTRHRLLSSQLSYYSCCHHLERNVRRVTIFLVSTNGFYESGGVTPVTAHLVANVLGKFSLSTGTKWCGN